MLASRLPCVEDANLARSVHPAGTLASCAGSQSRPCRPLRVLKALPVDPRNQSTLRWTSRASPPQGTVPQGLRHRLMVVDSADRRLAALSRQIRLDLNTCPPLFRAWWTPLPYS